uniref:NADH-ubiquinone oxidoreductase chain 4 n=1 Tax=Hoplopleura akanezumi TaxID=1511645 RepID=A0A075EB41_9NEOP|nr:NADH dehydrogenase subunit 4 [Hoplopleura akanezumi]
MVRLHSYLMAITSLLSIWVFSVMSLENSDLVSELIMVDSFSLFLVWSLIWVLLSILVVPPSPASVSVWASSLLSMLFYLASDWLMFYVWFEASMLPMFWLIISLSKSPERLAASRFLFMYTVMASFPLLIFITEMKSASCSSSIWLHQFLPLSSGGLWGGLAWLSFLAKLPMLLLHLWLLKAHVEAPMIGSMFLAGILLKFGGMGAYRLLMTVEQFSLTSSIIIGTCLWGSVMGAVLASLSPDIKLAVAYASVSHMNLGMAWGVIASYQGLSSFLYSMVAHSFSSSLLFFSATRSYEEVGSRSVVLLKGSLSHSLMAHFLGIVAWAINMNIPPFMGFWGEVIGFLSVFELIPMALVTLILYFVYSSGYSMILFMVQFHMKSPSLGSPKLTLEYWLQHLVCCVPLVIGFIVIDLFYIN